MGGKFFHHEDSNSYFIDDINLLRQYKQEAYEWKSKKIEVSKNGMFGDGKAREVKDFDFNQFMLDVAIQTSSLIDKSMKKEAKSELTISEFVDIMNILVKVRSGKEKEISPIESQALINFNQKLEASGGDPKILEKLTIITSRLPKAAPPGGPGLS